LSTPRKMGTILVGMSGKKENLSYKGIDFVANDNIRLYPIIQKLTNVYHVRSRERHALRNLIDEVPLVRCFCALRIESCHINDLPLLTDFNKLYVTK